MAGTTPTIDKLIRHAQNIVGQGLSFLYSAYVWHGFLLQETVQILATF